ncbi:MAG: SDR family NAD(P)-dependent oxidoreductase [Pseudomonadota bacterium]
MSNARHNDSNRVALITGAGRRVGRAIALGLAQDGFAVGVHYNTSAQPAEEVATEIRDAGGQAVTLHHDLSHAESSGILIDRLAEACGPVGILINTASLFDEDRLSTLTAESWRALIDVNLTAPVFLMQAFANQPNVPDNAAIINFLDTQLTSAYPERFSYFVGKFGLEGATRVAAFDLAAKGITVNAVAPGLILPSGQTEDEFVSRQRLTPLGVGLGTDHILQAVRYLISARQTTGHTMVVDAGQRLMGFGNTPVGA